MHVRWSVYGRRPWSYRAWLHKPEKPRKPRQACSSWSRFGRRKMRKPAEQLGRRKCKTGPLLVHATGYCHVSLTTHCTDLSLDLNCFLDLVAARINQNRLKSRYRLINVRVYSRLLRFEQGRWDHRLNLRPQEPRYSLKQSKFHRLDHLFMLLIFFSYQLYVTNHHVE